MGNIWWGGGLSGGSVSPLLKSRPCVFLQRMLRVRSRWSGTSACAGCSGVHLCALPVVLADPWVLCNPLLSGKIPQGQILRERTNTTSRPQLILNKSHEFRSGKNTCRNPGWLLSFELGGWVLVAALSFHHLLPHPSTTPLLLSVSQCYVCYVSAIKQDVFFFSFYFFLASFTQHPSFKIHPCHTLFRTKTSLLVTAGGADLWSCCQFGAITNEATMNIHVQTFDRISKGFRSSWINT